MRIKHIILLICCIMQVGCASILGVASSKYTSEQDGKLVSQEVIGKEYNYSRNHNINK